MIEMNISFSEEENSLWISWDPYSHLETHILVHALSFLFAVFKVAVNKEGLHLSPQRCRDQEGSHTNNKDEYLIFICCYKSDLIFFYVS